MQQKSIQLRVVSNRSVATFIKELTLEPLDVEGGIQFTPGDYLQLEIPPYDSIRFRDFDIPEPYRTVWEAQHVFDLVAITPKPDAAITTRWRAIGNRSEYYVSTCASPHRHRGRTVFRAGFRLCVRFEARGYRVGSWPIWRLSRQADAT